MKPAAKIIDKPPPKHDHVEAAIAAWKRVAELFKRDPKTEVPY